MATRLPRTTSSICPDFCEINVRRLAETLSRFCEARTEERARRIAAEAEAATAKAEAASAKALVSHSEALIARLKLEIEKVRRELYGSRPERKARLLEQMELQLEELEADAGEDELAAEMIAKASTVRAFERKRPSRKPFPEHLPRERVVISAPANCPCCGSAKLSKLGEDITETLEVIPRQWKGSSATGRTDNGKCCLQPDVNCRGGIEPLPLALRHHVIASSRHCRQLHRSAAR
jgi:hypothetical protein